MISGFIRARHDRNAGRNPAAASSDESSMEKSDGTFDTPRPREVIRNFQHDELWRGQTALTSFTIRKP
jgi:hypothetical protein